MKKLADADEIARRNDQLQKDLDDQNDALIDALETAKQREKEDDIVVDPIQWEEEAEKIKNGKLDDLELHELRTYGKILDDEDRIKMAKMEAQKFADQSGNASFNKDTEEDLSLATIVGFSLLSLSGIALLLKVIMPCGKDKAHPFEEFGGTRIYHESMVEQNNSNMVSGTTARVWLISNNIVLK